MSPFPSSKTRQTQENINDRKGHTRFRVLKPISKAQNTTNRKEEGKNKLMRAYVFPLLSAKTKNTTKKTNKTRLPRADKAANDIWKQALPLCRRQPQPTSQSRNYSINCYLGVPDIYFTVQRVAQNLMSSRNPVCVPPTLPHGNI